MTWLISKALMNSLSSQEQVEEYLGENFSVGEQSAQSSGKPTQQAYCAPDKMTGFSRLSRFGMTYKPKTESRGEELLTLYLAAFHAPTFPQQEKGQESMEKPLECGEKWRGSFTKYDLDTSLWKTHQCSLLGDLEEFSETWPQWGLMRDGECWEQRTLEHHIRGTGYGLSPNGVDSFHTPNTTGLDGGSNSRRALKNRQEMWPTPCLPGNKGTNGKAKMKALLFPTPTTIDAGTGRFNTSVGSSNARPTLAMMAKKALWPTPTAHNAKETNAKSEMNRNTPTLAAKVGGKLNPEWVEWLMGWPLGWTDLKPLATDKSHCVQQQHGGN